MVIGLGLTELLVLVFVALPSFLVLAVILYLVFRAGVRRGAADAHGRRDPAARD
jgi:hypothetical protein